MKCPNCGAESQGKFCEYCGSEMPQEKPNITITNNYYGDGSQNTGGEERTDSSCTCPKCGGSKVVFKREQIATTTQSSSRKKYIGSGSKGQSVSQAAYRTVGVCQNCGYTWNPNGSVSYNNKSTRKTWLWVIGWIVCFPIPLTILLLRNKNMKPILKYIIIAVVWLLFFAIAIGANSGETTAPSNSQSSYSQSSDKDKASSQNNSSYSVQNNSSNSANDVSAKK